MRDPLSPARGLVYGLGLALIFWAVVAAIVAVIVFAGPSGLRVAEDDAGWIPALYGNGAGHLDVFHPFPSLRVRDAR